jgi:hypothetical protein
MNTNKEVFVVTKFKPFGVAEFLFVAASKAAAEKELRTRFPKLWVNKQNGTFQLDKEGTYLFEIAAEPLIS